MSEYYSVAEYADKYNKDPSSVRRMLISGKLKGEKLGKQWMIPKGSEYPEDRRIKNGNYRNWRKRSGINQSNPGLINALSEMSGRLRDIYGGSLNKVILYGSYARGEETDDSDVDIAVIIKPGSTEKMHDETTNIIVDYELELEHTLSVVPIEYNNYLEWRRVLPFYKNIDKDGIVLWKAA